MILGIGCDIVQTARFIKWVENPGIIERFFTAKEVSYILSKKGSAVVESLAVRFAAKEAFVKALGCGFKGFTLKNIQIVTDEHGRPSYKLRDDVYEAFCALGGKNIHLSLSHEKTCSIAFAVLEGDA